MICLRRAVVLALVFARCVDAQAANCANVAASDIRVSVAEVTPVDYQAVAFSWQLQRSEHLPCIAGYQVRYRNVADYHDRLTKLEKAYFTDFQILDPSITSHRALLSIPGLEIEAEVAAVLPGGDVSPFGSVQLIAGRSPIVMPGDHANNAGVQGPCPSTTVFFSDLYGDVPMDAVIPEVVVAKDVTMVVDKDTPRIEVIKVFGCLTMRNDGDDYTLEAERILVAGKFTAGKANRDFRGKGVIRLSGFDTYDDLPDGHGDSFESPDGRVSASWSWLGSPAELATKVLFEICFREDLSDPHGSYAMLGFSPSGQVYDADYMVCTFDRGTVKALDRWTPNGDGMPVRDHECVDKEANKGCLADVELVSNRRTGDKRCCTVERKAFTFDDRDVVLTTNFHLVLARGTLDSAGELQMYAPADLAVGPLQYLHDPVRQPFYGAVGTKALVAYGGGSIEIHGKERSPSWTQLGASAYAGDTQITLKEPVAWLPGSEIFIADSGWENWFERNLYTVAAVSGDGRTLTLTKPLEFDYYGEIFSRTDPVGRTWDHDNRAEVGLLTRDFKIVGNMDYARSNERGGHVIAHRGSTMNIHNVEFTEMGQFDLIARYVVHWHFAGNAPDSSFVNNAVHRSFWRQVAVHGTNNVEVGNNVLLFGVDKAIWLEQGDEKDNYIHDNFVYARAPCVWYEGMNNRVIGNHLVACTVCFDFHLDDERPGDNDFGSFEESRTNGFIIPTGSAVYISTATDPFGDHDQNVCHSSQQVFDQWKHMYACSTPYDFTCGGADNPSVLMLLKRQTVYKVKTFAGGYWDGFLSLEDSRINDVCRGFESQGDRPGPSFGLMPSLGVTDAFTPFRRNSFIMHSDNFVGEGIYEYCGWNEDASEASLTGTGSLRSFSYFVEDCYFDVKRNIGPAMGSIVDGAGMRISYLRGTAFDYGTNIFTPRFNNGDTRQPLTWDAAYDLDGLAAQHLLGCSTPMPPSWIVMDIPSLTDPLVCQPSVGQGTNQAVCEEGLAFEALELQIDGWPANSRPPGLRYAKLSDIDKAQLMQPAGGVDSSWTFQWYFAFNAPSIVDGGDTHVLSFIDNPYFSVGVPEDELESCAKGASSYKIRPYNGFWPEDSPIGHTVAVRMNGYGDAPVITFKGVDGAPDIVLSSAEGYSKLLHSSLGNVAYDTASRYLTFTMRWPYVSHEWEIADTPNFYYDEDSCLDSRGGYEAFLGSGSLDFGSYRLAWRPEGDDGIYITIRGSTSGWIGFGLGRQPYQMRPGDVYICSVDDIVLDQSSGTITDQGMGARELGDYYTTESSIPPIRDTTEDVVLRNSFQALQASFETQCEFSRKLDTGDPQDEAIRPGPMNVIWALGPDGVHIIDWDPATPLNSAMHVEQGALTLDFFSYRPLSGNGGDRLRRHLQETEAPAQAAQRASLRRRKLIEDKKRTWDTDRGIKRCETQTCCDCDLVDFVINNGDRCHQLHCVGDTTKYTGLRGPYPAWTFPKCIPFAQNGEQGEGTANPTPNPTANPTDAPTALPTLYPTRLPTPQPTPQPTANPTPQPTADPTQYPTADPTPQPTAAPTPQPTASPTPQPTADPTPRPTADPTPQPTANPTPQPTADPTPQPTADPTPSPTADPTPNPTADPTQGPTAPPTAGPTLQPTANPTPQPTANPTPQPTADPTPAPTANPTPQPVAALQPGELTTPGVVFDASTPPGTVLSDSPPPSADDFRLSFDVELGANVPAAKRDLFRIGSQTKCCVPRVEVTQGATLRVAIEETDLEEVGCEVALDSLDPNMTYLAQISVYHFTHNLFLLYEKDSGAFVTQCYWFNQHIIDAGSSSVLALGDLTGSSLKISNFKFE